MRGIHRSSVIFPTQRASNVENASIGLTASWLFTQPFIQAHIKENTKAPHQWPLCGEFTGHRWFSQHKGPVTWKMFSIGWRHQDQTQVPDEWALIYLLGSFKHFPLNHHIDGLVQDCSISIANALEILQYCTNESIFSSRIYCILMSFFSLNMASGTSVLCIHVSINRIINAGYACIAKSNTHDFIYILDTGPAKVRRLYVQWLYCSNYPSCISSVVKCCIRVD